MAQTIAKAIDKRDKGATAAIDFDADPVPTGEQVKHMAAGSPEIVAAYTKPAARPFHETDMEHLESFSHRLPLSKHNRADLKATHGSIVQQLKEHDENIASLRAHLAKHPDTDRDAYPKSAALKAFEDSREPWQRDLQRINHHLGISTPVSKGINMSYGKIVFVSKFNLSKAGDMGMPPHHDTGAHIPSPPAIVSHAAPTGTTGPDTQQMHSHNGKYAPARAALHDRIIQHFAGDSHGDHELSNLYGDYKGTNPQRHAVFMMGGGGSGKSYYAKKKFLSHPRFGLVDPDAVKEHLPEYDPKSPSHVHEESSDVAKRLQGYMHEKGKNYVYDGTGANGASLAKKMQIAKDAGYKVHLHYASVPLAAALHRNANRTRQVPTDVLTHQHEQVRNSFGQVRHLADRVRVFDNTAEDTNPMSEHRAKRLAIANGMKEPISKGIEKAIRSHMSHTPTDLKKIVLRSNHFIIGTIEGDHVKVHDIVDHGVSERTLIGESPDLKPIPLTRLIKMGGVVEDYHHTK